MSGRLRPGTELPYIAQLRERHAWPPAAGKPDFSETTGPWLVAPASADDDGTRPRQADVAISSRAIAITDIQGASVRPVPGSDHQITVRVRNLGAMAVYSGQAVFRIASSAQMDDAAGGGAQPPVFGRTGLSVGPGGETLARCSRSWRPADAAEVAGASILVQVEDRVLDPLGASPFDAAANRHVARRDLASTWTGTWQGTLSTDIAESGSLRSIATTLTVIEHGEAADLVIERRLTPLEQAARVQGRFALTGVPLAGPSVRAEAHEENFFLFRSDHAFEIWPPARDRLTMMWAITTPRRPVFLPRPRIYKGELLRS